MGRSTLLTIATAIGFALTGATAADAQTRYYARQKLLGTTQTPVAAAAQADYQECAVEGGVCPAQGETNVRFGVPGAYAYRLVVSASRCDTNSFGYDPAPQQLKSCASQPVATPGWTYCALEDGTCVAPAGRRIRYGFGGSYLFLVGTGSTSCSSGTFGGDPARNSQKACYYSTQP